MHVINNLAHDPRPIDRIDRRQMHLVPEFQVIEQGFYNILTIIKRPIDGDVVHIGCSHRGHLAALYVRASLIRVHDEDIDRIPIATGLNSRRPGVTRCCTNDTDPFPAPGQDMFEQAPDNLQGIILEAERRAMKQFHQPGISAELF